MTQVLVLSTTFSYRGDEENFAVMDLSDIVAWLEADDDNYDELSDVIEEKCRFATMADIDDFEQLASDIKAGRMLELDGEQTMVVFAPVVAEEGELGADSFSRTKALAGQAMKELCVCEKDHPWD